MRATHLEAAAPRGHANLLRQLLQEKPDTLTLASDEVRAATRPLLEQGVAALGALARFEPDIAGPRLTLADVAAAFHCVPVSIASRAIYGEDVLAAIPAVETHRALMDQRPTVQRARAEQLADQESFQRHQRR